MIHEFSGEINESLILLDVMGWKHGKTTSSYIIRGENIAVFDPGGYSSGEIVLNFLVKNRIPLEDVKYIFVSHRHNDHSSGASFLVKNLPDAKIYAHRITIENLLNPEKINRATRDMYGYFSENIDRVDKEKVKEIDDGEIFSLGKGIEVKALHMPGHTSDHFMFLEMKNSFVFTGDGAGLFTPSTGQVLPNSFPPSFKYEEYRKSLQRLIQINPRILGFSHFGAVSGDDVKIVLNNAMKNLEEWKSKLENMDVEYIKKNYSGDFRLFSPDFREMIMDVIIQGFIRGITPGSARR
jgi:glyoxylase-like metal-dependent hydrolase (beta-lactamase superfamily II)